MRKIILVLGCTQMSAEEIVKRMQEKLESIQKGAVIITSDLA